MKLSTRKIVGIELVTTILFLVVTLGLRNAIWREYLQLVILGLAIVAGVALLGWARPRVQDGRLVAAVVVLTAVVYQVVMFTLLGIKLGFVTNVYNFSLESIGKVILPVILLVVLEEILRGQMIQKGKQSRLAVILTTISLILMETAFVLPIYNFDGARGWFDLAAVIFFPAVLKNVMLTCIAFEYDYRVNIAYRLIMELPVYVLPILPDVNEYLTVIFQVGLVFLLTAGLISFRWRGRAVQGMAARQKQNRVLTAKQIQVRRWLKRGGLALAALVMLVYVALMSGLFKYHFLAIGSGSMEPTISRGDMVLVKKANRYDELEEGEVLVYRYSDVVMVHRIAEAKENGGVYTFITKGDANDAEDKWVVNQGDVIGTVKGKITAFGYPTLWLNELFNGGTI